MQSPKGSDSPVKPKQTWAEDKSMDITKRVSKQSKQRDDILLGKGDYSWLGRGDKSMILLKINYLLREIITGWVGEVMAC